MIEQVDRPDDLRLAPYAHVGDPAWLREQGLFVAEGRLVVTRLVDAARHRVRSILVTPAALAALGDRLGRTDASVLVCGQAILGEVTGFNFHRGCLALAERPDPADLASFGAARRLLALEGIGNPDNVGGIFRSAAALGADGIVIGPATGDPYYRKALRTSMGAVLTLPWARAENLSAALSGLRASGNRIVALTPRADAVSIEDAGTLRSERLVLLLGAEGPGLSDAALAAADCALRIPIASGVDSLNVTAATGIALYALRP